jgi:hypothetical protein
MLDEPISSYVQEISHFACRISSRIELIDGR